MTATLLGPDLDFAIDPDHEAHEPPEASGRRRDDVRLMVSVGDEPPIDAHFAEFASFLDPGDVLVVNTSATIGAAFTATLPDRTPVALHYSGSLPGELALVEVRSILGSTTAPMRLAGPVTVSLDGGGSARLLVRYRESERLWIALLELGTDLLAYADRHGRPIRYRHVDLPWPLETYQTVFSVVPGSAEMPSASRPFSHRMVTDLVNHGVTIVPVVLHAGVSSLEGAEQPYPERYAVSSETARIVNDAHVRERRVVAVGTTVMRALATVTDDRGSVSAGQGWTETVVTKSAPVQSVSGLLTGWHEAESSHLLILDSIASTDALRQAYRRAVYEGYLWHEFGDLHLILSGRPQV
ncbi:MAG TPA: S-adenosylmethionine:tRNA ribosyltransferase-isomerase [Acidimicrobiales bacterium]|jgi:S-adenosylmethionine:tRNA ribosyltransferase-isomerase|nr:S-adenosylmethionine:tRNA ribosyltransferase-isomerase [Acidimicrobiales bacterium]